MREDRIERADGSEGIYSVVDKPPFAIVVAHDAGMLHLVQQFRYPVGSRQWELPQGTLEDKENVGPLEIARTELAEETGLAASEMTYLGLLYPAYGLLNQEMHVFLAEGLSPTPRDVQPEEQDLITQAFPVDEVRRMIVSGELTDSCTISALYLWEHRIR